MREIIISQKEAGQRIDKYIRKYLSEAPLSLIYKTFRKKDIKINGHWVNIDYILKENDILRIYLSDATIEEYSQTKVIPNLTFSYPILFEDNNVLMVYKPSGLLVHGDEKEKRVTLTNHVLSYLVQKGEYSPHDDHGFIPAPAHRLDRNTSGIVVFGKNMMALQALYELFQNKDGVIKKYLALVVGHLPKDGVINKPLIKDETKGLVRIAKKNEIGAKTAVTEYHVLDYYQDYTLVEVRLLTGRTHQIRVHMASIGYPLAGDGKYGDFKANRQFKDKYQYENQFLHAYSLEFGKIEGYLSYLSGLCIKANLGKKEQEILNLLKK